MRFDQIGSENSSGDFYDSSLLDMHKINGKYMEEGGQRVNRNYWIEASGHNFMENLKSYGGDCLIIYGEKDKYISASSRKKVIVAAKRHRNKVIILKGEDHNNWSYSQAERAIDNTADFFVKALSKNIPMGKQLNERSDVKSGNQGGTARFETSSLNRFFLFEDEVFYYYMSTTKIHKIINRRRATQTIFLGLFVSV